MSMITRAKNVFNSHFNSLLYKLEDPEKMVQLLIDEVGETLSEVKSSCAYLIAGKHKIKREMKECQTRIELWERRALLAITIESDDLLAKEALLEKIQFVNKMESLNSELQQIDDMITQAKTDIDTLEIKLNNAKEKRRSLINRHIRVMAHMNVENDIRRILSYDTIRKFEEIEQRIEEMEIRAGFVNYDKNQFLDKKFMMIEASHIADHELKQMKTQLESNPHDKVGKDFNQYAHPHE